MPPAAVCSRFAVRGGRYPLTVREKPVPASGRRDGSSFSRSEGGGEVVNVPLRGGRINGI